MKFKKGQIVYAKSQDYGNCIVQLRNRIIKNVMGEVMKSPIWYGYILDTDKDRGLMEFLLEGRGYEMFVGFFENLDKFNYMEDFV